MPGSLNGFKRHQGLIRMNIIDLIHVSWRQIVRYRRRYYGVILAIALGTAGLQTVVLVSRDFKKDLKHDLTLVGGVTVIKVYFDNQPTSESTEFQRNTLEALQRLPGVEAVCPVALRHGKTNRGQSKDFFFPVVAMDETFWQARGFWAATGRLFGREAVIGRKRKCVLGGALAEKLFGQSQIAGRSVEICNESYQVTGVLGGITDSSLSDSAYLPITTAQDRFPGRQLADRVYLRCRSVDDVIQVAASVTGLIEKYQSTEHLYVEYLGEGLKRVKQVFFWGEFFTYLTIGLTIGLGGLGIWIVMLAAVRSRTREVGLKKAFGAEDAVILKEFLAEAVILSLGSSFMGIILGWLTLQYLTCLIDCHPSPYLLFMSMGLELVFGMFLGIAAGHFPARQASRMEVAEAVRYE